MQSEANPLPAWALKERKQDRAWILILANPSFSAALSAIALDSPPLCQHGILAVVLKFIQSEKKE